MFGIKVGICEVPVKLGVGSRNGETDACQHVIRCHPVDVVLIDFCSDDDAVLVFLLSSFSFAGPALLERFRPSGSTFVMQGFVQLRF